MEGFLPARAYPQSTRVFDRWFLPARGKCPLYSSTLPAVKILVVANCSHTFYYINIGTTYNINLADAHDSKGNFFVQRSHQASRSKRRSVWILHPSSSAPQRQREQQNENRHSINLTATMMVSMAERRCWHSRCPPLLSRSRIFTIIR